VNPQLILALIAKFTDLAKEDAEKLAKALDMEIQPTNYKTAEALVDRLVGEVKTKR
jgi:hypothetical protein